MNVIFYEGALAVYGNVFVDTPYDREQNSAYPLHSCSAKTPDSIAVNAKTNLENMGRNNQPRLDVCVFCFKVFGLVRGGAVVGFV